MLDLQLKMQNGVLSFCILYCALGIAGCRIPSLETPECNEARNVVKQFYSLHFDGERNMTPESLKMRERFLTPELSSKLAAEVAATGASRSDYFTASDVPPKTFKIGNCETPDASHANIQVQVYWKDDIETIQKDVHVSTERSGDNWLIDKVSN